ncbi:MAG TPA: malto-oligosyltrehalose trehalohydrolase [Methylomirabilota bacterium]|nr:malto-oligosyltrehalose trehalohydrolase [Methylomirabilota bacterium]
MSPAPAARRAHRMPFGAEVREDGTTRFRLWAPGARQVELWLEAPGRAVAMPRDLGGWAEYVTREAPAGTRYRYRIDGELLVPDPAARFQPGDVHGASLVVDPLAHAWTDTAWIGLPPERLVFYELHVGAFTPAGTYAGVAERLDHLVSLGVTAIELMPLADFPGRRGWGYDGVLLYAPEASYGRPEDLKALVDAAHARDLAVFLDVVYNHFGPEGNYLHRFAPDFFNPRHQTPWGDGINYDGPGSEVVRAFIIHNALYWIEEYHLDGLRLDAVNAIVDESPRHLLVELARAVADGPARERRVHLVLENGANEARYLRPVDGRRPLYQAQWNDDVHHALHVLLTAERGGYYGDYQPPLPHLGRCLTEGFAFQGERSAYREGARGEPCADLPPTAFVAFLQNHDQIGNRALGERITAITPPDAVRAATAVLLLSPAPPLLFMGEEWAAPEPFLFFSDLGPDLGPRVSEGRRREFARFPEFADPATRARIPDPQAPSTFERSTLDWSHVGAAVHKDWLAFHQVLLTLRARAIAPLLAEEPVPGSSWKALGDTALEATWTFPTGTLRLVANLGAAPVAHDGPGADWGCRVYALGLPSMWSTLPPWSVALYLAGARLR